MEQDIHYNGKQTLTHNCLWNYVSGTRREGKTYWFKKWSIDEFIKKGECFAYLRRFGSDLEDMKFFFSDIQSSYPQHTFEVKQGGFFVDNEVAGIYTSVNQGVSKKGIPYPRIHRICYDEYSLKRGKTYLKNEVEMLLDLYITLGSLTDPLLFAFANSYSAYNPHHLYWDLEVPKTGRYYHSKSRPDVLLEYTDNLRFKQAFKNSRIGGLIDGTTYGDTTIDNKFVEDTTNLIAKKTGESRYFITMRYEAKDIGVWWDFGEGVMYLSNSVDKQCAFKYAFDKHDLTPNHLLIKNVRQTLFVKVLNCFYLGGLRFETQELKAKWFDLIKKF